MLKAAAATHGTEYTPLTIMRKWVMHNCANFLEDTDFRLHFVFYLYCSFNWRCGQTRSSARCLQTCLERLQGLRLGSRWTQAHLQVFWRVVWTGTDTHWFSGHYVDNGPKRRYSTVCHLFSLPLVVGCHLQCFKSCHTEYWYKCMIKRVGTDTNRLLKLFSDMSLLRSPVFHLLLYM